MPGSRVDKLVRFGPFELDLSTADLYRAGGKLRLPEQQFRILAMLLRAEGNLVSREDIRKRLWPNDTVVEFDRSINSTIKKLRAALGDSADQPEFIETVAKRGYRIMVEVHFPEDAPPPDIQRKTPDGSLIGQRISHYRVLTLLGGGGMGLVYKAEDLKLNRPVALKFLPAELASDSRAIQRFEREARAASALNHPNICTIHGVEEYGSQPFIVMELLEGESLRDLIAGQKSGPSHLPLPQILEIAVQIAAGLEAAHEKGIVHRDIKPANIFVTRRGPVKILDFGLAKIAETAAGYPPDDRAEPDHREPAVVSGRESHVDQLLSRTGITMGTAAYMSPEQVRGEKLDARTDLFSFGLVLFEMATGQRAFSGDTAAIVQDVILHRTLPPMKELNSELPVKFEEILHKALEKGRESRYQTAAEMLADLRTTHFGLHEGLPATMPNLRVPSGDSPARPKYAETTPRSGYRLIPELSAEIGDPIPARQNGSPEASEASPAQRRTSAALLRGLSIALTCLAVVFFFIFAFSPATHSLHVIGIRQITRDVRVDINANLTLCGSRVYFLSEQNGNAKLASILTSGGTMEVVNAPFKRAEILGASPDGAELLFARIELGFPVLPVRRTLWRYWLATRTLRRVGNMFIYDAAWLPDGSGIIYSTDTDQTLYWIDPSGLNSKQLARLPGIANKIRFAPDGKRFRASLIGPDNTITLWEFDLANKMRRRLLSDWGDSVVVWSGGWLVGSRYFSFVRSDKGVGTVWALPEPAGWLNRGAGKPVQLAGGPVVFSRPVTAPGGTSVYVIGKRDTGQLMRYDLKTKTYQPFMVGLSADQITYSPDGKWMAYVTYPDHTLITSRVDGSERLQLTFAPQFPDAPRWSPDSSQILFEAISLPDQKESVFLVPARGGTPRPLAPGIGDDQVGAQWSSDGQSVIFFAATAQTGDMYAVHRFDWRTNKDIATPGFKNIHAGLFSPDGSNIAAQSGDAMQTLIVHNIASNSSRMLAPYVEFVHWSGDGKYLFYSTLMHGSIEGPDRGAIYRVRVADGKTETFAPHPDFTLAGNWGAWMDFAPDGSPLVLKYTGNADVYGLDLSASGQP